MEIQGTRFGVLEFKEEEIILINEGLLGFPMSRRFILFPYGENSSFFWLQSIDEPEIAFIVINPFDFFAHLEFVVQDDDALALHLERQEDVEIFTLVTIPEGRPEEMRTNLAGPVVVNTQNRQGRQILVKEYSPRQLLIPPHMQSTYLKEREVRRVSHQRRRARNRTEQAPARMAAAG
ncbi:MAG: flagellar assembly protein FliW [Magnetococcales bacterium]|nr:flagellar assembly protein FliW [Magnetococcales bacterium]MBF0115075.1 flagellar assembly protein FliW [Magnetococcales bacterium]